MWMLVLFASWHDLSPLPRRWAVLLGVWPCLSVGCGCCPLRSFLVLPGRLPSLSRPEQCLRRRRGMRDGRAARADAERAGRDAARITAPQISRTCPAAPYGVYSAAPGSGKTIALTFDDGPGPTTARIMSILASYKVTATFFNIGENMAASPSLLRSEDRNGYMLGNHTWDHPDMTTLSASAQAAEMDRASAEQHSI